MTILNIILNIIASFKVFKIIHKIFLYLNKKKSKNTFITNLKKLDKKYDIINLLINDLIRYMKLLPDDYSNDACKNYI